MQDDVHTLVSTSIASRLLRCITLPILYRVLSARLYVPTLHSGNIDDQNKFRKRAAATGNKLQRCGEFEVVAGHVREYVLDIDFDWGKLDVSKYYGYSATSNLASSPSMWNRTWMAILWSGSVSVHSRILQLWSMQHDRHLFHHHAINLLLAKHFDITHCAHQRTIWTYDGHLQKNSTSITLCDWMHHLWIRIRDSHRINQETLRHFSYIRYYALQKLQTTSSKRERYRWSTKHVVCID